MKEEIEQRFAKYVYRHGNIDAQGIFPCIIEPLKENPPLQFFIPNPVIVVNNSTLTLMDVCKFWECIKEIKEIK